MKDELNDKYIELTLIHYEPTNVMKYSDKILKQIEEVIKEYEIKIKAEPEPSYEVLYEIITRFRAALQRICPINSAYIKQSEEILSKYPSPYDQAVTHYGVLKSLQRDLIDGYVDDLAELLHGEIFSDFIEMSEHLLSEGYKDAAAVIAGSTLETHLRQLCIKSEIEIEYEDKGKLRPKKADKMNSDLAKEKVYSKTDQKNVTAWLDLRNNAAHGKYEEYQKEQVAIIITAIRDFLTRNPA